MTQPDPRAALLSQAQAQQRAGRLADAAASYDRAAAAGLDTAALHFGRGFVLAQLGRLGEALPALDRALARDPALADARFVRGALLADQGRAREALADYDRLVALRPDMAEAHSGRGDVLRALGRPAEAVAAHDRAVALRPAAAALHVARGLCLARLGRRDGAASALRRAVELEPNNARALAGLAREQVALGDLGGAEASLRGALAIDPALVEARLNRALLDLLHGRLAEGFSGYELRWQAAGFTSRPRGFRQPQWRGEPLAGRTLLLHAEQGFGDTIQFCRYVPLVAARVAHEGARLLLEVQPALLSLLQNRFPGVAVLAGGEKLPVFDTHCPLMSLPAAFGTTLATIPPPAPDLAADPARVAAWRARLGDGAAPRVGLVWSGSPAHWDDAARSIPLFRLLPLCGTGARLFALQPEVRPADRAVLAAAPDIFDLGGALTDFGETAAAICALDLVITVDTSVAHLAATLRRPTWVLLPFAPDWRWLLEREDLPWYASARLFRQPTRGDWDSVVRRVCAELAARAVA